MPHDNAKATMTDPKVIGNFELIERIGQGGMGAVFKARQISMDRIVAVKVLPQSLAEKPTFIERFMREAHASARLNHPNVVRGIDVGQDSGIYYFAMEFVQGANARTLIKPGGQPEAKVLGIAKAIAGALAHAHEHGILHRDIKPDNILIDDDGRPKLCDLGLARLTEQSEEDLTLTQAGSAVGTPLYISPEQARGFTDLDAKTDLYSLGATIYHLLVGKAMFSGATAVVIMTQHVTAKCPNPAEHGVTVSRGTMAILAKLLAKDRADRYESATLLAEDIGRVQEGEMPQHANLPAAKWPFTGSLPANAVRRSSPNIPGLPSDRMRAVPHVRPAARGGGMVWIGIGVALAAAVGVGAFLLMGHGGVSEPTSPDAPKSALPRAEALGQPSPDDLARKLLDAAADVAQRNPGDVAAAIAAYQKVLAEAGASPLAARAKDAITQLERSRDAITAIQARCAESANGLAASGKYDDAIAVWDHAAAEQGAPLAAAAAKAVADLRAAAEARLAAQLGPVEAAIQASRWAEARTTLASAGQIGYAAALPRLAELKKRIDAGESDAQALAVAQAMAAFRPTEAAFVTATLRADVVAAQKILHEAQGNPGFGVIAPRLAAMSDLCAAIMRVDALPRALVQAAQDGKPHSFSLSRGKVVGTVSEVNDRDFELMIEIDGGGSAGQHFRYSDFSRPELKRLRAGFHAATAAEHLALAVPALAARDEAAAASELKLASEHPLAEDYRGRLDELQMGVVEAAAKAAWESIARESEGQVSEQKAAHLLDEIKAFSAAHGKTKFVASITDKLNALTSRLMMVNRLIVLDTGTGVKVEALLVPPGTFVMGSPMNELGHRDDEMQHEVTLTKPCYLGRYLVTQEQFQAVMSYNPSQTTGPDFPVEGVDWNSANNFCDKLSALTGRNVRLPTEAEWEYACRAGTTTAYSFGDDASQLEDYAWFRENSDDAPNQGNGRRGATMKLIHAVGEKKANPWGFFDMHGDIVQWCQDYLAPYDAAAATDPTGPAHGDKRVIRGGSVDLQADECRSAWRLGYASDRFSGHVGRFGFRICVDSKVAGGRR
jgi:formylglycine-generating enzyme required for sulfatase activity/tRNA A-37 threonylcarbamoyl transferase component Bud32